MVDMARKPKKFDLKRVFEVENIADEIATDVLSAIGERVVTDYDEDKASRSQWETNAKASLKLALQIRETKTTPWEGSANVKYPLLTLAAIEFAARAYPEIITDKDIVHCITMGEDPMGEKADRAQRISSHMSYQLREEMKDWVEDMDKLLHVLPILGVCYKKTYFDPENSVPVSELVMPFDLVVDSSARSFEKARRKSQVLRYYKNEVEEKMRSGIWRKVDIGIRDMTDQQLDDRIKSEEESKGGSEGYFEFISSHRWWDLDGDGYEEPYIITVDYQTHEVMRIEPRFYEGSIDEVDGEIQKIVPDEYFTEYQFIPSSDDDILCIGLGQLLGPVNETLNTSINQSLDSASLVNMQSGFISKNARIKGGVKSLKPNEWKMVDSTGDDLKKSIIPLPVHEPSKTGLQMIGMMIDAGEKLASTTDPMMGQSPGSRTPASTISQLIEQGTKVHSAIFRRIHRSLKKELEKLYMLNKMYLPDETYFNAVDSPQLQKIGRSDYSGDPTDVRPNSDPSMMTDHQKAQKAQTLMQLSESPMFGSILEPMQVAIRYLEVLGMDNVGALFKEGTEPNPQLLIEQAKLENDKAKLDIKRAEMETKKLVAEANVIKLKSEALKGLAEVEIEVPDGEYARATEKFGAIEEGARRRGRDITEANRGMEGGPGNEGNAPPPEQLPPEAGGGPY